MEKIFSPCIKYRTIDNPNQDMFAVSYDHASCYDVLHFLDIYENKRTMCVEGFITIDNRFVDRREAYQIAKNAGQLVREDPSEILKSYNVRCANTNV